MTQEEFYSEAINGISAILECLEGIAGDPESRKKEREQMEKSLELREQELKIREARLEKDMESFGLKK